MAEIHIEPMPYGRVGRANRGAASELQACAALMIAGYYVYRCESPSAPFDLVAYRDGRCFRVEVKSLTWPPGHYAPCFSWPANSEWDLLAVIGDERPFIFTAGTSQTSAKNAIRDYYGYDLLGSGAPSPCGTDYGYRLHLQRNEDPDACEACGQRRRLRRARSKTGDARRAVLYGRGEPSAKAASVRVVHFDRGGDSSSCGRAQRGHGTPEWSADPMEVTCKRCHLAPEYEMARLGAREAS